ncbi:MAG TPA: DNA polymerase subunit beta [Fibrobacteres bacterium]|jgi:uncharacterized protein|nr:DNA polymerase subunit beta [Fibrobacterota bacterium]
MISIEMLNKAAELLLDNTSSGTQVILFGSHARNTATNESDADFLVIEPELEDRHSEMVRLRRIMRPLRIPVDVVVVSRKIFEEWKDIPNTLLYDAVKEGKNYGIAA